MYKKIVYILFAVLFIPYHAMAATPFGGLYSYLFGGLSLVPNNIAANGFTAARYFAGYDAGGSLGYKSGPFRYAIEGTYIHSQLKNFRYKGISQKRTVGSTYAGALMLDAYYDFEDLNLSLAPYLGVGLGGSRVYSSLTSKLPPNKLRYRNTEYLFSYQGFAGITYNFSEDISSDLHYSYFRTTKDASFGRAYQAHLINLGVTYRFNN